MSQPFAMIPDLIRHTLRDPRSAARRIIEMRLPVGAMWEALFLVIVLSVITAQVSAILAGGYSEEASEILPGFFFSPIHMGFIQGVLMVLMVLATYRIGRAFGGHGDLSGAVSLVVWLQFLMVCLQVAQGIAILTVPFLSGILGIAGVIAFFYLLTQFICELHGFERPGMVFAGIIGTMFAVIIVMSVLLGLLGIGYVEVPDV